MLSSWYKKETRCIIETIEELQKKAVFYYLVTMR